MKDNTLNSNNNEQQGRYFAESELIINEDGSVFHLHVKACYLYENAGYSYWRL